MSSTPMPLWHLKMTEAGRKQSPAYECVRGFIVAAPTCAKARQIAQENGGEESTKYENGMSKNKPFWTRMTLTTVRHLAAVSHVTEEKVVALTFDDFVVS